MPDQKQTLELEIIVDEKGAVTSVKKIDKGMDNITDSTTAKKVLSKRL